VFEQVGGTVMAQMRATGPGLKATKDDREQSGAKLTALRPAETAT